MKIKVTRFINLAIALVGILLVSLLMLVSSERSVGADTSFDAAGTYKAKCAACHGPTAAKHFDKAKADESLIEVVMKGKKAEKPPNMPGYGEKGVTAEQAKALVDYMKQL